jgi:hypothetical protein
VRRILCLDRETDLPAEFFEYLHNVRAAEVKPRFDRRREARECVNDREHPQLRPVASWSWTKSIPQVSFGCVADRRSSRSFALTLRFGGLFRNLQAHLAVQPVDPLRVDEPPLPTQQHMDTTIAVAHPSGGNLPDAFDQMSLPGST